MDRQLLLCLLEKINKIEEEKEHEKTRLKEEIKQDSSILWQEGKVIWVKFGTLEDKNKIIEREKRLGQKPIYIKHDRTREERDVQRETVRYVKELREDNREVKIKYEMIEVDGIRYRWNERWRSLKEEKVFHLGTGIRPITLQREELYRRKEKTWLDKKVEK